jgi:hypothetical protein
VVILVSGATTTVVQHPEVGVLVVPGAKNRPDRLPLHRPWAMDNGAFAGLDIGAFQRMLETYQAYQAHQPPRFVVAPDVVADAAWTTQLFRVWEPRLHAAGWPVAYVGQDGLTPDMVPWDHCEAIFLGGSTVWKLGPEARALATAAVMRGKWLHMGRVNTDRRIRYAARLGCHSIDGTSFSRWARRYIPRGVAVVERFNAVGPLFTGLRG